MRFSEVTSVTGGSLSPKAACAGLLLCCKKPSLAWGSEAAPGNTAAAFAASAAVTAGGAQPETGKPSHAQDCLKQALEYCF